jgi:G8 domain
LFVCLSGRNRLASWEYVNVNAVVCRFDCSGVTKKPPKSIGLWSDANIWPSGSVPNGSETVIVIPSNLSIIVDIKTPQLQTLIVEGQLSFATSITINTTSRLLQDGDRNDTEVVLRAKRIWIKNGSVSIGSPNRPYTGKGAIVLDGNINDDSLIIDPFIEASSKVLAVTGELNIYAQHPETVWTRLADFASAGDINITVL